MDRENSRFLLLGLLCSAAALAALFVADDTSTHYELLDLNLAALQHLDHEHLTTAQMMAKASKSDFLFSVQPCHTLFYRLCISNASNTE